jgi:hypothetical protein
MQQLYNGEFYKCTEEKRVSAKINELLNSVQMKLHCGNDAQLARALNFAPPEISKLRHRVIPLSAAKLARISEATGWSVYQIRDILKA